jgi:phage terminase large subunit-like protein
MTARLARGLNTARGEVIQGAPADRREPITPGRGSSTLVPFTIINVTMSLKKRFSLLPKERRDAWIREQPTWLLKEIARNEWWWTSRPEQIPPDGDWLVHLALAGRGWGKSMAGSEWLVERCLTHPFDKAGTPTEWLVIAETLSDARLICLEGPAGILRVLKRRGIKYRYIKSPKPMIVFEDDTKIYCEGADSEDVGRGYNASGAWLDEIAKWKNPKGSWYEGIMPSLRADLVADHPRCFVTTTPKPIELIREWLKRFGEADPSISVVRGSTFDNVDNLSRVVIAELRTKYEGTAIGRQELHGEMLDLFDNSMFSFLDIERNRVDECPDEVVSIIVGVDPNLTGEEDEMGVVVVARTRDNHHYILSDQSSTVTGRAAALHCWRIVAQYNADFMVYENNLGKAWMAQVLRDAYMELVGEGLFPQNTTPPMKSVDSKLGKKTRAEPVAMRYQQGKVHHVGKFQELENQLVNYDFTSARDSPDRLDALVHAVRYLMAAEKRIMKLATPAGHDLYDPRSFEGSYFG